MRWWRPAVALVAMVTAATLMPAAVPSAAADSAGAADRTVAASSIAVGGEHTCVLLVTGRVRCWGAGLNGRLGYGNTARIGDDEPASAAGTVRVGGRVVAITAGVLHTCALLTRGRVRCWGANASGQLGYGHTEDIGDDETPASAGNVRLGGRAVTVVAGGLHTCAVLASGRVRCWGEGAYGQLGYGNVEDVGDDETPAQAGAVPVGRRVRQIAPGRYHTCAVLFSRRVRCWGLGGAGRLGYGTTESIGDDETPAAAGNVPLGSRVQSLSAGDSHTCVVTRGSTVRCWGRGGAGRLGYGDTEPIGDDETPASAGDVSIGGGWATAVTAGLFHTCARTGDGSVWCWGSGDHGALGYGDTEPVGDDETPGSAGSVPVGGAWLVAVDAGAWDTCALNRNGRVRCWGANAYGQLGHGHTGDVGDDETPASVGNVPVGRRVRVRADTRVTVRIPHRRDRRAPYSWRIQGRVHVAVADRAEICRRARVRVTLRPGHRDLTFVTVRLRADCTYRTRLRLRGDLPHPHRRHRLRVRVRLLPDHELAGDRARTTVVAG